MFPAILQSASALDDEVIPLAAAFGYPAEECAVLLAGELLRVGMDGEAGGTGRCVRKASSELQPESGLGLVQPDDRNADREAIGTDPRQAPVVQTR